MDNNFSGNFNMTPAMWRALTDKIKPRGKKSGKLIRDLVNALEGE